MAPVHAAGAPATELPTGLADLLDGPALANGGVGVDPGLEDLLGLEDRQPARFDGRAHLGMLRDPQVALEGSLATARDLLDLLERDLILVQAKRALQSVQRRAFLLRLTRGLTGSSTAVIAWQVVQFPARRIMFSD